MVSMSNTASWSKTRARRELGTAARLAREVCRQPRNVRVEIGTRVIHQNSQTPPATAEEARELAYPEGDDLRHHEYLDQFAEIVAPGDVLHMYVSESCAPGDEPYLCDIVVVWIGVGDEPTRVIDPRFVTLPTASEKFVADHFVVIPVKI